MEQAETFRFQDSNLLHGLGVVAVCVLVAISLCVKQ